MSATLPPTGAPVRWVLDDGLLIVTIDHPPVNALSHAVRVGLMEAAERLDTDAAAQAMLLCSTGTVYIGGADIREFSGPRRAPMLNEVCHRIEACTKPVIAVVHGAALGGGLEVALASHYRVAAPAAMVAFPEVLLGLLPGAGGTQRAPRLCGAALALDLMLTGRRMSAADALDAGLVDVVDDTPRVYAERWARTIIAAGAPLPRARDGGALRDTDGARAQVARALDAIPHDSASPDMHAFARARILRCVTAAIDVPFEQGAQVEADAFLECLASPEREVLVAQFFAARAARKAPNG
ncbi:enoyl-CoA hydratase/isomerase family protein [Gemmatimonas sp.]|uniref:enoyl-CoA hydratase/isomerase family protein n=1 Tax=Gemmatimonas sp. TaxID=1962908 RepID=UPI0027BA04D1|nr:enoyl-CoA hydratase/isomerase family protein [Gemmatimonas sp.]